MGPKLFEESRFPYHLSYAEAGPRGVVYDEYGEHSPHELKDVLETLADAFAGLTVEHLGKICI